MNIELDFINKILYIKEGMRLAEIFLEVKDLYADDPDVEFPFKTLEQLEDGTEVFYLHPDWKCLPFTKKGDPLYVAPDRRKTSS